VPADRAVLALDLVARHRHARTATEVRDIRLGELTAHPHLTSGWSPPAIAEPEPGRWSVGESATISFHLRETGRRGLRFLATPSASSEPDPKRMQVRLNGTLVADRTLVEGAHEVALSLPAAVQRRGQNELQFLFNRADRPVEVGVADDSRELACYFEGLTFEIEDGQIARRVDEGARLVEGGSVVFEDGVGGRGGLRQLSRSELVYHLRLPAAGSFDTRVRLAQCGPRAPEAAEFEVWLQFDGEAARRIGAAKVGLGEDARRMSIDLSPYAGRVARLELRLLAEGDSPEPLVGEWLEPAVLGEREPPSEEDPDVRARLDELRSELAGAPVVAVLVDACNPLFLACYGDERVDTPRLDRLAAESIVFDNAYSTASYTLSAVGSILSPHYAWEHDLWDGGGTWSPDWTWPEAFQHHGYATVALVNSLHGSSLYGFDRGFETFLELYHDPADLARRVPPFGDVLFDPTARLVEVSAKSERPLFLWAHVLEPHSPYTPPEPFSESHDEAREDSVPADSPTLIDIQFFRRPVSHEDVLHLEAQYRENIEYLDRILGQFLDELEGGGVLDEAILVLFSDHGEAFLDQPAGRTRALGHGGSVNEDNVAVPLVAVPLMVRLPPRLGLSGRRASQLVANTDLFPTLADLTGIERPPDRGSAQSFAEALVSDSGRTRELLVSHSASANSSEQGLFAPELGLRVGRHKLVRRSCQPLRFYDVEADPDERHNLAPERPIHAAYLEALLFEETDYDPELDGWIFLPDDQGLDEATKRQLEALGYVR